MNVMTKSLKLRENLPRRKANLTKSTTQHWMKYGTLHGLQSNVVYVTFTILGDDFEYKVQDQR